MKGVYIALLCLLCIISVTTGLRLARTQTRNIHKGRLWSGVEVHEPQPATDASDEEADLISIPTFLPSQRNIDYVPLATMLAAGDYKAADQFTRDNLIRLAGEEAMARQFVYWTEVAGIPSVDLATMERLWLQFSGGKFGFSVQKRIWAAEGGNFDRFIRQIGWTTTADAQPIPVHVPVSSVSSGLSGMLSGGTASLMQDELSTAAATTGTERLRKWFGSSEFIYDVNTAPRGHLPLTNAIRGTQLIRKLLEHPVWDQYDWRILQV